MDKKPRNVRNFWITTDIGQGSPQKIGPQGKGGGFETVVYARHNGEPYTALVIEGTVDTDTGRLLISVDCHEPDTEDQTILLWFEA